MSRELMVNIGPCSVPIVPLKHMSKLHVSHDMLCGLWRIVGPTAQRNLSNLPLWHVIVAAYAEGLEHGYNLHKDKS